MGGVNKTILFLFISAALLGLMALMPEGALENNTPVSVQDSSQDRNPSSLPAMDSQFSAPASGEPSDNGLTKNLHREFREALNRDPLSAIELAKEYVFTRELDPGFRLEILRELKAIQFSQPGVADLADEIILMRPELDLFEEALSIKYATMSEDDYSVLISELALETDDPEYASLIEKHAGTKSDFTLSSPLYHTAEEPSNTALEPEGATVSG